MISSSYVGFRSARFGIGTVNLPKISVSVLIKTEPVGKIPITEPIYRFKKEKIFWLVMCLIKSPLSPKAKLTCCFNGLGTVPVGSIPTNNLKMRGVSIVF